MTQLLMSLTVRYKIYMKNLVKKKFNMSQK
jgi:hypothetical protein